MNPGIKLAREITALRLRTLEVALWRLRMQKEGKVDPMEKPFDIQIFSREDAENMLASKQWNRAISISDPQLEDHSDYEEEPPEGLPQDSLILHFHDISRPWYNFTMPTLEDVKKIAHYARGCMGHEVLCHCFAGVSRSTAAAWIAYMSVMPKNTSSIKLSARWILERQPIARPNRAMIEMADDLFGLGGLMVQTNRDFPQ